MAGFYRDATGGRATLSRVLAEVGGLLVTGTTRRILAVLLAVAGAGYALARIARTFALPPAGGGAPTVAAAPATTGTVAADVDVTVTRVRDGDTVDVRIDDRTERVRLLGVDTPERAHDGRAAEPLWDDATDFVERALSSAGNRVRLVADPLADDRDRYGRLLRYVELPDGSTLNETLIRRGLGVAMTRWPYRRADAFVEAEIEARAAARGVWSPEVVRRIPWREAPSHDGEIVEIEGRIVSARCDRSNCYLNFDPDYARNVSAVILGADRHRFAADPAATYRDRVVRVVGQVTRHRDRPQILLRSPDQIRRPEGGVKSLPARHPGNAPAGARSHPDGVPEET